MAATMKLVDGREVPIDSPEWRHECEARYVAKLPTLTDRRIYLSEVERRRGWEAAKQLRETVAALWESR